MAAARDQIISRQTMNHTVAGSGKHGIRPDPTINTIRAAAALDQIIPGKAMDGIIAIAGADLVIATGAAPFVINTRIRLGGADIGEMRAVQQIGAGFAVMCVIAMCWIGVITVIGTQTDEEHSPNRNQYDQ